MRRWRLPEGAQRRNREGARHSFFEGVWSGFRRWPVRSWGVLKRVGRRLAEMPVYRRWAYAGLVGMMGMLVLVGVLLGLLWRAPLLGALVVALVSIVWLAINLASASLVPVRAKAKPLRREDHRRIFEIAEELAFRAGVPAPRLWIVDCPDVNAFACGRDPAHASLVLHKGGLDLWNEVELRGVMAHEIAHIKNRDVLLSTVMVSLYQGMSWSVQKFVHGLEQVFKALQGVTKHAGSGVWAAVLGFACWFTYALHWASVFVFYVVLLPVSELMTLGASRQQEYHADLTAAGLAGSADGLASALGKIEGAVKAEPTRSRVDLQGGWEHLWSTHPPTEERIRRLRAAAREPTNAQGRA